MSEFSMKFHSKMNYHHWYSIFHMSHRDSFLLIQQWAHLSQLLYNSCVHFQRFRYFQMNRGREISRENELHQLWMEQLDFRRLMICSSNKFLNEQVWDYNVISFNLPLSYGRINSVLFCCLPVSLFKFEMAPFENLGNFAKSSRFLEW